jgi:hypothetical protein
MVQHGHYTLLPDAGIPQAAVDLIAEAEGAAALMAEAEAALV